MRNTNDIAMLLLRELEGFEREISMYPDDESVWQVVPGVANSAGNLAMHVAGNIQHYIGAVLGNSGYRRDRGSEFARRSGTREEIVLEIRRAEDVVRDVLPRLPEEVLAADFPEAIMGMRLRCHPFLLHLCVHAGFHLGQAGFLRRAICGVNTSSGPLPLQPLAQ